MPTGGHQRSCFGWLDQDSLAGFGPMNNLSSGRKPRHFLGAPGGSCHLESSRSCTLGACLLWLLCHYLTKGALVCGQVCVAAAIDGQPRACRLVLGLDSPGCSTSSRSWDCGRLVLPSSCPSPRQSLLIAPGVAGFLFSGRVMSRPRSSHLSGLRQTLLVILGVSGALCGGRTTN